MNSKPAQWMATTAFLTLIFFLIYRIGWLSPPKELPKFMVLILLVGPLMLPLRGILHGRLYTFGWAMFLALFYFTVGVLYAADTDGRWQGILVALLSILWFTGSVIYVRKEGQAGRQFEPHEGKEFPEAKRKKR